MCAQLEDSALLCSGQIATGDREGSYSQFIWWWLHHSDDESRVALMVGSYYDESAVDGGGPISAVGGILLNHQQYTWLKENWATALLGFPKPYLHMKDFGLHGDLANFPVDEKRKLLARVVKVINDRKLISIGSVLVPDEYRTHFGFLKGKPGITIHSACFIQAAVTQTNWANGEQYVNDIPFMLDGGCPDRRDIDTAHALLASDFLKEKLGINPRVGGITWEDDTKLPSLQAADVVAWSVRRKASNSRFDDGYEPLLEIFDDKHHEEKFDESLMREGASAIRRAKLGP